MSELISFTGQTPEELGKKRFEVKVRKNQDGTVEKAIFIGGEMLDWAVDMSTYADAMKMGFKYRRAIQEDIEKHFIESVSDFLSRKVTMKEIKEAIATGWI